MTGAAPHLRWRRLAALLRKESLQVARDPSSLLIAVVLPLIILFLSGYGVSFDIRHSPICLVVQSQDEEAQGLAGAFQSSPFFAITRAQVTGQCRRGLAAKTYNAIVVIPADYKERLFAGDAAPMQILTDGSDPNTAGLMQVYLQGTFRDWQTKNAAMHGRSLAVPIAVAPRIWFNSEQKSRNYVLPGLVAVIMTLIGTLLTSLVVAREWDRGTMEAMLATPVTRAELIVGKLAPYYVLGMAAMAITTLIAIVLFHVPFRGSVLVLAGVSSAFLLTTLGTGMIISTLARNQFVATQAAMFIGFLPGFLLSGMVFEIASMPLPIRLVTLIVPARYFVPALTTLFLAGDEASVLVPNTVALLGFAAVIFAWVAAKTPRRLD